MSKPTLDGFTVAYLVALVSIACILGFSSADQATLCADGEDFVPCLRNWIGAGTGLVAVVAAIGAAYFALGQMTAARVQAEISALPVIESQLQVANAIDWLASEYFVSSGIVLKALSLASGTPSFTLPSAFEALMEFRSIQQTMAALDNKDAEIREMMRGSAHYPRDAMLLRRMHSCYLATKADYLGIREYVEAANDIDFVDMNTIEAKVAYFDALIDRDKLKVFYEQVTIYMVDAIKTLQEAEQSRKVLDMARARIARHLQ